ncbi:MAG TPA: SAM-dependent methyltransferase [Anaerolineales bacterium]|nr:SAM-dependent methyltransferase [Anaerolineales bacterium]
MTQFIYTCAPESEIEARDELKALETGIEAVRRLAPGVFLARCEPSWKELAARLVHRPPVWTRHVNPVSLRLPLRGDAGDLAALEAALPSVLMDLDTGLSFSIQTRLLGESRWAYSRFDVNERLAAVAAGWGAALDVRAPDQALSVVCIPGEAFLGISLAAHNLSSWAGGEIRYRKEPERISRAEFKLLEALETFRVDFPKSGRALDLGASPGGWTRLLLEHGLEVTAVDPAELDPRLSGHPGLRHIRARFEDARLSGPFDVVLNDMRLDARDSARLMADAVSLAAPGALSVMTLKLPENRKALTAEAALRILARDWNVLAARQLFHNRNEVTVVLRR